MSASFEFPSPIGGVPFHSDLAPSVVFAVLYAAMCPLGVYRVVRKDSRTLLVAATLIFAMERVIFWSLRAHQANTPSEDFNHGITAYWQISFGAGYMALYSKLVSALKALVMNALEPAPSALSRQDFSQSDPSTSPTLLQDADKQGQDYAPHSEPKSELPITGDEAQDPALVRKRKVLT